MRLRRWWSPLLVVTLAGCAGEGEPPPELLVIPDSVYLLTGGDSELVARYRFAGGEMPLVLFPTWTSSDEGVIELYDDGTGGSTILAVARNPGTAVISARGQTFEVEGSMEAEVGPDTLVAIELVPAAPSIAVDGLVELSAMGQYDTGSEFDIDLSAVWVSSDEGVAQVDERGGVFGLAPGEATITASFRGIAGSTTVTVTERD